MIRSRSTAALLSTQLKPIRHARGRVINAFILTESLPQASSGCILILDALAEQAGEACHRPVCISGEGNMPGAGRMKARMPVAVGIDMVAALVAPLEASLGHDLAGQCGRGRCRLDEVPHSRSTFTMTPCRRQSTGILLIPY